MTPGGELRAWRRAGAKIGDLAWPVGVSTGARTVPWHGQHRKVRKLHTTGRTLVAAELERQPARISARLVNGTVSDEDEFASPVACAACPCGAIGKALVCNQEVEGSIPFVST